MMDGVGIQKQREEPKTRALCKGTQCIREWRGEKTNLPQVQDLC